jgi:hypothetical protein
VKNPVTVNTVLIVSPHFPPSTLAGVHRGRHLAKHLPAQGWNPVIIRLHERFYTEQPDPVLASLVPATVRQVRVDALPARLTRLAGVGDVGLRAYTYLARAVESTAAQTNPRAVLITGSPFYPMLLSNWIKKRLGMPVVLDFQDPWVSAFGATQPAWSKAGVVHRLAQTLEPRAVRSASFITSVSETQNAQMAALYPWLDAARMAAIPIGGDPEDFQALRAHPLEGRHLQLNSGLINLSYVGAFLPRAAPLVRSIFRSLRATKDAQPRLAERIRLNFVGTSNQPDYSGPGLIMPIALEAGVADLVNEIPERVPFLKALGILANSTGLLLIGSDEPHYTASKIYPALMSGRPYVSLFHSASSSHRILSAAGGGRNFSFSDVAELPDLTAALSRAIFDLASNPEKFGRADATVYEAYSARSVASRFAEVFEQAARFS